MVADEHDLLAAQVDDFFLRSRLANPQHREDCFDFVRKSFPGKPVALAACQGYCSLTLFVGDATVVQFRPWSYRLDLTIANLAHDLYGSFAPETKYLTTLSASGLLVYGMDRIDGISYKTLRVSKPSVEQRQMLCKDLAIFLSQSWNQSKQEHVALGNIGLSIVPRLKSLIMDLPTRFQAKAKAILRDIHRIEALPWVLTHGDVVASNIMVNAASGRLTGLVDWAEAEYLPFGVCMYGLEEVLGQMTTSGFEYRDEEVLRAAFWTELEAQIPALRERSTLEAVKLARDLGILLWHGIAFDDGQIDRVVQEGRDIDEIHRLDAFLDIGQNLGEKSSKI
ncbi:hypothetical protein BP6252_02160 [Coleophoma cylindrospora]|uniref:Aminoglycoside phosphotransferase domain-containing protein n=1 Tax=Coleophoma cylindrospora TaxID=1849047 RepID=A0A3D8SE12_9HELO|nr:hypothetical protein BP6252_02160 [Coleophoma cylindrospora]